MINACDRVEKLLAGRRDGSISLRQFKAEIKNFTNGELACLAATLLEVSPGRREPLERALRQYGEEVEVFSRRAFRYSFMR